MPLRDSQIERYSRQIIMPGIGGRRQQHLLTSAVALVGRGPLIAPVALYLVAAGIGRLDLYVQRAEDAAILCQDLRDLNPDTQTTTRPLQQADRAVDRSGTYQAIAAANCDREVLGRLNAVALRARVPLVTAQVGTTRGWLAVFAGHLPDAPCALCDRTEIIALPVTQSAHPLTPAVAGAVGSLQALAILGLCLPGDGRSVGTSTRYDGERSAVETRRLTKHAGCRFCNRAHGQA